MKNSMPDSFSSNDRPGIFAFALLISAWTTLFWIALKNQPESVPLQTLLP
jgi:hypothetical protein